MAKLAVPAPTPVRVRINASGKRLICSLKLPPETERVSDLLNAPAPCLQIYPATPSITHKTTEDQVLFKDSITYVETLEEPKSHTSILHCGQFVPVVGELREPELQQILAEIYIPYDFTLFDVLNDSRMFVSMRNVHFTNFMERYPFLAINKRAIISIKG